MFILPNFRLAPKAHIELGCIQSHCQAEDPLPESELAPLRCVVQSPRGKEYRGWIASAADMSFKARLRPLL